MTATGTRTFMVDRAAIGSRWRRRRDGSMWLVRQSWRRDRQALLIREGSTVDERVTLSFDVLRDYYEEA